MSSSNKVSTPRLHAPGFKIAVAREYLTGNQGYGALARKYGLSGAGVVRYFVRWYKANYGGKEQLSESPLPDKQSQEVEELRRQLAEANLKVAGFEMLMEIAKKELGVDVKKYGTKQSGK